MKDLKSKIKIAFVEDNQVFYQALKILILENKNFDLVGMFSNAESLLSELSFIMPEVVIIDLDLPGISGVDAIGDIKKNNINVKVLVLTIHEDEERIISSLKAGADGYLLKKNSIQDLSEKIYAVVNEGVPMSLEISKKVLDYLHINNPGERYNKLQNLNSRELDILKLISEGFLNKEIADKTHTSIDSVKKYVQIIYEKLEVRNRGEAIKLYLTKK